MGKTLFAQHLELIATADSKAACRPFANPIDSEKRCSRERRGEKCRRRVGFVMFRENDFPLVIQLAFDRLFHPKPLAEPQRKRFDERTKTAWRTGQIRVKQAIKLQARLFVTAH